MRRLAKHIVAVAIVWLPIFTYAQTASVNPSAPMTAGAPAKMSPQQAQILADTQKLRKLSEELKAEVDRSSKETLSVAVIKKSQQLEKLARSLKDEMSKSH